MSSVSKIEADSGMIVFVDPFNHGLSHVPVNAGIIETALAADPDCKLVVAAEKGHLDGLAELVSKDIWHKAQIIPIEPPPPGTRFMARLKADYRNLEQVFSRAKEEGKLILADIAPATLYALRLNSLRYPRAFRQLAAVLHGNGSELAGWRARNPLIRATQLRSAMLAAPAMTRFVVLEDSIREALLEVAPEFAQQMVSLPHPLPTAEGNSHSAKSAASILDDAEASRPLRIGFLGAAETKKGFDSFVDLARSLTRRFAGKIEFHAIGWLPPERYDLDLSCLARQPSRKKISRAEFRAALEAVDYVCMPYSPELYRYSASGTLLDAVAAGKPLIALRSPIFDDLETHFGDIGELGDNLKELESRIDKLVSNQDARRYQRQADVMQKIRTSRMPAGLVPRWRSLFLDEK